MTDKTLFQEMIEIYRFHNIYRSQGIEAVLVWFDNLTPEQRREVVTQAEMVIKKISETWAIIQEICPLH